MVKRRSSKANTFRYIQIWSVSVQVFKSLFLSSTNLETKSCQTVAGGEYESRRSRVEQVFLLFFLFRTTKIGFENYNFVIFPSQRRSQVPPPDVTNTCGDEPIEQVPIFALSVLFAVLVVQALFSIWQI